MSFLKFWASSQPGIYAIIMEYWKSSKNTQTYNILELAHGTYNPIRCSQAQVLNSDLWLWDEEMCLSNMSVAALLAFFVQSHCPK